MRTDGSSEQANPWPSRVCRQGYRRYCGGEAAARVPIAWGPKIFALQFADLLTPRTRRFATNFGSRERSELSGGHRARETLDRSRSSQAKGSTKGAHTPGVGGLAWEPARPAQRRQEKEGGERRHQNDIDLSFSMSLAVVIGRMPCSLAMLQTQGVVHAHLRRLAQLRPCCRARAARSSYSGFGALAFAIGNRATFSLDSVPQGVAQLTHPPRPDASRLLQLFCANPQAAAWRAPDPRAALAEFRACNQRNQPGSAAALSSSGPPGVNTSRAPPAARSFLGRKARSSALASSITGLAAGAPVSNRGPIGA